MTVHVGVIGAGTIGQEHIRRVQGSAGATVAAVADLDPARAEGVAAEAGARVLPNGAALVSAADVDAVLVASWAPTHAEYVLAAIAAGKPVFCEKPLATTADDCLRIVEAEASHGTRLVQVGFMRRYDAGYRAMRRTIGSGEIGAPLVVHCVHRNPTVPERYTSEMATLDTAIHEIDIVRWMLDDEIISTQVVTPRPTSNRFEHLRDPQIMLYETATGARIDVEVFVNAQYGYDIQCEVVGETGVVRLPDPARVSVRAAGQARADIPQDWEGRFAEAYNTEIHEWLASVGAGTVGGPSSWDGYAAAVIGDATVAALHSGAVVDAQMKERPALYA
jgi:myo-inositol 2-dehydrogenase/D-chiro-inositol 1-dehydrogenase